MNALGGNAAHRARNMVRRLISEGKLLVVDSEGYVDDLLVEYNKDYVVATIDKELLGRLPGKKATLRSGITTNCGVILIYNVGDHGL